MLYDTEVSFVLPPSQRTSTIESVEMILRSLVRAIWLPILLLYTAILPYANAEEAIITLLENPAWSYRAELAEFGYILDQRLRYNANFMTPPMNETQLCSFPTFTLSDLDRASQLSKPVALLVSLGGCETGEKVKVALEIHKKITNFLRFIVFYNNDPNNPDEIFKVNPPVNTTTFVEDLEEMSFSAISTATSSAILAHMQQVSAITGSTSEFLGPRSEGWLLEMIIETAANPYMNTHDTTRDSVDSSKFYWFRIVLFALLVLSPFCRAMFLWWTGGGRIRLRRNHSNRVVGFLYTPPMAYWFVSHGTPEAEPVADTMTTEEVMALPEIMYQPPPSEGTKTGTTDDSTDDSDDNDASGDDNPGQEEEDGRLIKIVDRTSATLTSALQSATGLSSTDDEGFTMTTCSTACSICIDDFEAGEKIRLLPCGHAFHTECILPWLTRRQGCCPMCKTRVMGHNEDEETNTDAESTPFSRCLDHNSGVETIEESATRSVDPSVAAGDAEIASSGGANNVELARRGSTNNMMNAEVGTRQELVDAVVNGFDDTSGDFNAIDIRLGEDQLRSPDSATALAEYSSDVESGLAEIEESEAAADRVASYNDDDDDDEDDVETPIGIELSKEYSQSIEANPSEGEGNSTVGLSTAIKASAASLGDQEKVENGTKLEFPQPSDLPKHDTAEESSHSVQHAVSEVPISNNDDDEGVDQDESQTADVNSTTLWSGDAEQVESATELEFQQSSDFLEQEASAESSHAAEHEIAEAPIPNDDEEDVEQNEQQITDKNTQQSAMETDEPASTLLDSEIQEPCDPLLIEDNRLQESDSNAVLEQPEVQDTGDNTRKDLV
ncbi:MAG: hypothetical protein SGBAC_001037 [Bacillariaceae sp.]